MDRVQLDMICRCGENAAAADALRKEVRDRLAGQDRVVTDADFLTHVVISLNWDYGAYISGIHNDQWSMVSADSDDKDGFKVAVMCDDVEDGIAAVWKAFADRKEQDGGA